MQSPNEKESYFMGCCKPFVSFQSSDKTDQFHQLLRLTLWREILLEALLGDVNPPESEFLVNSL